MSQEYENRPTVNGHKNDQGTKEAGACKRKRPTPTVSIYDFLGIDSVVDCHRRLVYEHLGRIIQNVFVAFLSNFFRSFPYVTLVTTRMLFGFIEQGVGWGARLVPYAHCVVEIFSAMDVTKLGPVVYRTRGDLKGLLHCEAVCVDLGFEPNLVDRFLIYKMFKQ